MDRASIEGVGGEPAAALPLLASSASWTPPGRFEWHADVSPSGSPADSVTDLFEDV